VPTPSEEDIDMGGKIADASRILAVEIIEQCQKTCIDRKFRAQPFVAALVSQLLSLSIMLEHEQNGPEGVDLLVEAVSNMTSVFLEGEPVKANLKLALLRREP